MSDAKIVLSDNISGFLPCNFSSIWKTDPPSLSLLSSLTCCMLCQINRLSSSPLSKSLGQSLVQAIESVYAFAANIRSFDYIQRNVNTFVDYSCKLAPDSYEKWIVLYSNQLVDISVLLIAKALLDSGNYIEASNLVKHQIISITDEEVYEKLSNLLNIAIEVFYSKNEKKVFTGNRAVGEVILITLTVVPPIKSHEFGIPYHKLFMGVDNSEVLKDYPFTYTITSKDSLLPQPSNIKKPIYELNATDNILIFLNKILKQREWKFSRKQAAQLNSCLELQNEEKIRQCKQNKTLINFKLLKKHKLCEHPNSTYSILSCGEKHCIECMHADIKLRSLKPIQIYCRCKNRLNDRELKYYFGIGLEPMFTIPYEAQYVGLPQKSQTTPNQFHPLNTQTVIMTSYPPKPNDLQPDDPNERGLSLQPAGLPSSSAPPLFKSNPTAQRLIDNNKKIPSISPIIPQNTDLNPSALPAPKLNLPLNPTPQSFNKPSSEASQQVIPQPQFNFCSKCSKPVNTSEQVSLNNRYYHKGCANH